MQKHKDSTAFDKDVFCPFVLRKNAYTQVALNEITESVTMNEVAINNRRQH